MGTGPASPQKRLSRRSLVATIGSGVLAGTAGCIGERREESPAADLPAVTLYDETGTPVELTIVYDVGSSTHEAVVTELARHLEWVGIELALEGRPDIREAWSSRPLPEADLEEFEWGPDGANAGPPDRTETTVEWDLLWGVSGNSFPRTPAETASFFTRDGSANVYGYVPTVDLREKYTTARQETDPERRRERFSKLFETLSEDLPVNPMFFSTEFWGVSSRITTGPDFTEYGAELAAANRFRDERTVGGDFVQLEHEPMRTLYPPEATFENDWRRLSLLVDGTYDINSNGEVVPLWLSVDDPDDDATVYVCTLREGLEWGTDATGTAYGELTADDWVFYLEFIQGVAPDAADAWDGGLPSTAAADWEPVETVTQTGRREFQLELSEPDPAFPLRPALWKHVCLPKALSEQYMPDADALRESPEIRQFTWTGNLGPYTFVDRTAGEAGQFSVQRNPDYYMREHATESDLQEMGEKWAEAPYFERYRIDTEDETATAVERFRQGNADAMELSTAYVDEFRDEVDAVRVEAKRTPFLSYLPFNMRANGHPLLDKRAGREALCLVIDKTRIASAVLRGHVEPARSWQPIWSAYYDPDTALEYGIDVTEADVIRARDRLDGLDGYTLEET